MPTQEEIQDQQELLRITRRNVAILLRQIHGFVSDSNAPPYLFIQLEENREKIATIKSRLRGWGVRVEDHPDDGSWAAPPRQAGRSAPDKPADPERGQSPSTGSADLPVDWPSSTKPFYLNLGWVARAATVVALVFIVGALAWPSGPWGGDPTSGVPTWGASATTEPSPVAATPTPPEPPPSPTITPITTTIKVSLKHVMSGHTAEIWGARFNPEDNTAFTSGKDGLLQRWSTQSGMPLGSYAADAGELEMGGIAVSPDGTLVAGAYILDGSNEYGEGFVQVYQVADKEPLARLNGHTSYVWTVDFSPDGQLLASGSADGTIRLWNVETGAEKSRLRGHTELVTAVAFSPDGQRLASVSKDGSLRLWDVAKGERLHKTVITNTYALDWTPDSLYVASTSGDQSIHIIDAGTAVTVRSIEMFDDSYALAISPNGQLIAGGCHGTAVCLWDFQTGVELARFGKNSPSVLDWNADGTLLIEGGKNQQARIWSVNYESDGR